MNLSKIIKILVLVILIALAIKLNWFGAKEVASKLENASLQLHQTMDEDQHLNQNNHKETSK
jgi:uncharacterized membrane protein